MIVLVQREPRPDVPYWPGRRLLAAVDAVIWPMAWVAFARFELKASAQQIYLVAVVALLFAALRLCGAVFENQRYRFTTWWVARLIAVLLFVGVVMKLVMTAFPAVQ